MEEIFGIKRLIIAVLAQSLKDLSSPDVLEKRRAFKWFEDRSNKPFGFLYCMKFSGLSEEMVQRYVKEKNLNKIFRSNYASLPKYRKPQTIKSNVGRPPKDNFGSGKEVEEEVFEIESIIYKEGSEQWISKIGSL